MVEAIIKEILVPLGHGMKAEVVIRRARDLADRHHAHITLLSVASSDLMRMADTLLAGKHTAPHQL